VYIFKFGFGGEEDTKLAIVFLDKHGDYIGRIGEVIEAKLLSQQESDNPAFPPF